MNNSNNNNITNPVQLLIDKKDNFLYESSFHTWHLTEIEDCTNAACLALSRVQYHFDNYIVELKYGCTDVQLKEVQKNELYKDCMSVTGENGLAQTVLYFNR